MVPTEAGSIYLDMARQILSLQARTVTAIQARHNRQRQVIRVGVSPHRGAQTLAALYHDFVQRYPQIEIDPVEGYMPETFERLRSGQLDLGFATIARTLTDPALRFLPTHEEEVVLALPAFHRLAPLASRSVALAPQLELSEFRDTPFVLMTAGSTMGQISRQLFAAAGFEPVVAFQSGNVVMVTDMVRTGAGAGLIPAYYARTLEDMVYFRLRQPGYMTFSLAWQNGHELSEAERYLIYLKIARWDLKNFRVLNTFLWPEEVRKIIQEFDPNFSIPQGEAPDPRKEDRP